MSSAKVYDLFSYSNIYFDQPVSELVWYSVLFDAAMEIISLSNTSVNITEIHERLQMIISRLIAELRLKDEFPIYSFCKVIG
jgi:hypothetical protein